MFLRTEDEVEAIRAGWRRLETLVPLRGRKFFGAFNPSSGEYRVCVQSTEGDDPTAIGLDSDRLPGGRYLRARLQGEPPRLYDLIPSSFDKLLKSARHDDSRPCIEFYRRHDEVDLLLPIRG
jgi:hypothetical protein